MSLYGLDIIIDGNGKNHLIEVNGINSGMTGFQQIYGDNRVEEKVYSMLEEKYGKLTVNNCEASLLRYKKEHFIANAIYNMLTKIPSIKRHYDKIDVNKRDKILYSKDSHSEWMNETTLKEVIIDRTEREIILNKFEKYIGQKSTVINILNEKIAHPSVNNRIAQEITWNKFFQYEIFKDTEIKENISDTALVGLGLTDRENIERLVSENDNFVVKPIMGSQGMGIKFMNKEEIIKKYLNDTEYTRDDFKKEIMNQMISKYACGMFDTILSKKTLIEEYIDRENYSFEYGLAVVQPFIDSLRVIGEEYHYSSIRAIVCNGEFVNAYMRVSMNPKVNMSQGASPIHFDYDNSFKQFCEKTIKILETKTSIGDLNNYKKSIYTNHIKKLKENSKINIDPMQILMNYQV